jgi:Spy/CpxP family protein refolding chaperone
MKTFKTLAILVLAAVGFAAAQAPHADHDVPQKQDGMHKKHHKKHHHKKVEHRPIRDEHK